MKTNSFSALCLLTILTCFPAMAVADPLYDTLVHDSVTREYYVHLPTQHFSGSPPPLVIVLHGGGGTAEAMDRQKDYEFSEKADQLGWILVFPQGVDKQWNDGRVDLNRDVSLDDVGFISALIDKCLARYGADPSRVYVAGMSNGGMMTLRLAIDLSHRLAAAAAVTANLPVILETAQPVQPIPLMLINGTDDPVVPYYGGMVTALG
ncbi:MAG: esterase, partial [Desulfovibrio sp.]